MSPTEFEFLIQMGKKSWKETYRSEKPFLFKKVWHWRYVFWQVVIHALDFSTCSKFPSSNLLWKNS